MPLTYHFRPFPSPSDPLLDLSRQPSASGPSSASSCSCQKEIVRCETCRQQTREDNCASSHSSQAMLSSIKEETDPSQRPLTPKAIRDQRRAATRAASVGSIFSEAVGTEDYFTFYHSTAFARSPSGGSRERSSRRVGSSSSSQSRKPSAEQACLPTIPDLAPANSRESVTGGAQELPRRDS
jgi:hypothetical protein